MIAQRARFRVTAAAVALFIGAVYVATMHPGVGTGDAAELQHCSAVLGVCHPPGYPLIVLVGHAFSMLPIGPDVAWRVNFMTLLFGVAVSLLVFAIVARITSSPVASVVAAGLFAFSTTPWSHAVLAEVYTFYGAALFGALYALLRWVQSNRPWWLMLAAVLYGICIGNRPSEIFLLPAFLVLWLANRRRLTVHAWHVALAAFLTILPFAASVGYYASQATPVNLSIRDNAGRDAAVDGGPLFHELTGGAKLVSAVRYCLGLRWAGVANMTDASLGQAQWDLGKFFWLISGIGAWSDRFPGDDPESRLKQLEQGSGVNLTPIAIVLAIAGLAGSRRRWRYTGPITLLIAGNLAFYLWHHPPDNLEFTLPGIASISILAGVGVAGARRAHPSVWRRQLGCASLCLPLVLLAANWNRVNQATPENRDAVAQAGQIGRLPFPEDATIVTSYPRAMRYRYSLHVTGGRPDVHVVFSPGFYDAVRRDLMMNWLKTIEGPVFFREDELMLGPSQRTTLRAATAQPLADAGFVQLIR